MIMRRMRYAVKKESKTAKSIYYHSINKNINEIKELKPVVSYEFGVVFASEADKGVNTEQLQTDEINSCPAVWVPAHPPTWNRLAPRDIPLTDTVNYVLSRLLVCWQVEIDRFLASHNNFPYTQSFICCFCILIAFSD